MMKTYLRLTTFALLLAACSSDSATISDGGIVDAGIVDALPDALTDAPGASPIVAPAGVWTFVPVAGNVCDDGSATGIGVNPGDSDKLVVYFEGGGACGDYTTCFVLNLATHGPFGAAQLPGATNRPGSIFDRDQEGNPFATYTMVYVPYCTGDVHSGVVVNNYANAGTDHIYHHAGHLNALAALDRLVATWPTLTKLVVTGASAGGYGSAINYDSYRARWPSATAYLVDDSGPLLAASATPQLLLGFFATWGLTTWIPCQACMTEPSQLFPYLAGKYASDRMALLSSLQDQTIRSYYMLDGDQFQAALEALATNVLAPLPKFHHFFVSGQTHTMLGLPESHTSGTVVLWTWLGQMIGDDVAWTDANP